MIALHYKPHTRAGYQRTLGMFTDFLGKRSIASVTHLEIREFMTQVANEGATWSSSYRHLGILRSFYHFLNLGEIVSYVAPRMVKIRAPRRELPPVLSEKQIQQLIAATRTLRERAVVEFMYGTGCRLREATHLRVNEVDLDAGTARVSGKYGKVRIVLLTKSARRALRAYVGNRKSGFVFRQDRPVQTGCLAINGGHWVAYWIAYGRDRRNKQKKMKNLGRIELVSRADAKRTFKRLLVGVNLVPRYQLNKPLSNMAVQVIVRMAGVRAGLKNVGPHMLRRSFATHLYDHGASPEVIQALLGHVFLQTTMKYTRLSTGRLVKTFEQCHPRDQMNA